MQLELNAGNVKAAQDGAGGHVMDTITARLLDEIAVALAGDLSATQIKKLVTSAYQIGIVDGGIEATKNALETLRTAIDKEAA